jgi:hypothetical protein
MVIKAIYNYAHAMTVLQKWLKDDAQENNSFEYTLNDKRYTVGLSSIVYLSKRSNILNFYIKNNEDDIKVTEEASLNLINKDFENKVEISFNTETPYELDCINHIFTLLSTDIMNMSDAW